MEKSILAPTPYRNRRGTTNLSLSLAYSGGIYDMIAGCLRACEGAGNECLVVLVWATALPTYFLLFLRLDSFSPGDPPSSNNLDLSTRLNVFIELVAVSQWLIAWYFVIPAWERTCDLQPECLLSTSLAACLRYDKDSPPYRNANLESCLPPEIYGLYACSDILLPALLTEGGIDWAWGTECASLQAGWCFYPLPGLLLMSVKSSPNLRSLHSTPSFPRLDK